MKTTDRIELSELRLSEWRSFHNLNIIVPPGHDVIVYGRNFCGKSTVAGALTFLFDGRDILGGTKFEARTIQPGGETVHHVDHTVEASFRAPSGDLSIKKVRRERWTTKRNQADPNYDGDTTEYEFDRIPCSETDFTGRMRRIFPNAEACRMLMDPVHFCQRMTWQERRRVLMTLTCEPKVEGVVALDERLMPIADLVKKHGVDDAKKIANRDKDEAKFARDGIPGRIDEQNQILARRPANIPREAERAGLAQRVADLQQRRANVSAGGERAAKAVRLQEIESEKLAIRNRYTAKANEERQAAISNREAADLELSKAQRRDREIAQDILFTHEEIAGHQRTMDRLRTELAAINAEVWTGSDTCATCGQAIPEEQIAEAKAKFNLSKARRAEPIQIAGKAAKAGKAAAEEKLAGLLQLHGEIGKAVVAAEAYLDLLREIPAAKSGDGAYLADERYEALLNEEQAIQSELAEPDPAADTEAIDRQIREAQSELEAVRKMLAAEDQAKLAEGRIRELEGLAQNYAAAFEDAQQRIFLLGLYESVRCRFLEDDINSHFSLCTWKLFDIQKNGGIADCCTATIDGRPYDSALSNSERINVGLDIINALSKAWGIALPVVIDNCESVTHPLPTIGQQIRFVVSEQDETLRFEFVPREPRWQTAPPQEEFALAL